MWRVWGKHCVVAEAAVQPVCWFFHVDDEHFDLCLSFRTKSLLGMAIYQAVNSRRQGEVVHIFGQMDLLAVGHKINALVFELCTGINILIFLLKFIFQLWEANLFIISTKLLVAGSKI